MFGNLIDSIALGVFRHFLTLGGGVLIAHGWASQTDVSTGIGAIIALLGVMLSVWHKYQVQPQVVVFPQIPAVPSPPGTTADDLNQQELDAITGKK